MTVWHMKDLVNGKRKLLKSKDIKHVDIPQFEGLAIKDLLQFAEPYKDVVMALPMTKVEVDKLPRQYIANVIYTIVGEAFATWVHRLVDARHRRVKEEEGMIELDAEIAAIYQQSTAVSKLVGNSHNLMKSKY